MSSIRDAIVTATRESLSSYLAPDLVEQLTEEIITRAAPQMEEALRNFAGFELGRPGAVRAKIPTQGPARNKANKPSKKQKEEEKTSLYMTAVPEGVNGDGLTAPAQPN